MLTRAAAGDAWGSSGPHSLQHSPHRGQNSDPPGSPPSSNPVGPSPCFRVKGQAPALPASSTPSSLHLPFSTELPSPQGLGTHCSVSGPESFCHPHPSALSAWALLDPAGKSSFAVGSPRMACLVHSVCTMCTGVVADLFHNNFPSTFCVPGAVRGAGAHPRSLLSFRKSTKPTLVSVGSPREG